MVTGLSKDISFDNRAPPPPSRFQLNKIVMTDDLGSAISVVMTDNLAICLLGPLRTEKHLWRITSAAIAVAMVTGIIRCM